MPNAEVANGFAVVAFLFEPLGQWTIFVLRNGRRG